ncbi:hypothetical protein [Paenibacillus glufosinatiresistens]|uniref:hypothetical protein n=1 Tax=Paenibacillus glufosinatiresistens TaxID=3070657 RepID=UPI00286DEFE7|nr:hypothetical protein [Paenibacillus sp. YX.27]
MSRSRQNIPVVIEPRFPGKRLVGGKYHLDSHTVFLYKASIVAQCVRLFGSTERLKEYIEVVLAHELGHAQDRELRGLADALDGPLTEREEAGIRLRIEENAWQYAQALLWDADPLLIGRIIDESLAGYREQIQLQPESDHPSSLRGIG